MSRQERRQARQKARDRAKHDQRRRLQEAIHVENLLLDADRAAARSDWNRVHERLSRVLDVRPNHGEARERLAHACFLTERLDEGLAFYDSLDDVSETPGLTYLAALASWRRGGAARARVLALQFLSETAGLARFEPQRAHARALAEQARLEVRRERTLTRTRPKRGADVQAPAAPDPDPVPETRPLAPPVHLPANRAASSQPTLFDSPERTDEPHSTSSPVGTSPHAAHDASAASPPIPRLPDPAVPASDIQLTWDQNGLAGMLNANPGPVEGPLLRRANAARQLERGFDELVALAHVRDVEHFWYQIATVRRVLRDFRGRALLADEVGLGKTIEAALILKEYWMRGLVQRALVLVPPSLVSQWVTELTDKFGLEVATPESHGYAADPTAFWSSHPLIVASLALARQAGNRERLADLDFDLVIVDEAHYLKKRTSASWQLANNLKKRFLLLLSATPVGNDPGELFSLITLLKPGLLSTEARFRREYGRVADLSEPARRDKLRALLSEVMVRNTRAHIDLRLPRRLAATIRIEPHDDEREVLAGVDAFVRARYIDAPAAGRMSLMSLQMQAGSSLDALAAGLGRHDDPEARTLARMIEAARESAKMRALIDLLARSDDKAIVFTRYRATIDALARALARAHVRTAVFHGGLAAAGKDAAIADFAADAHVLLASEIGGEGRNLQFCRTVINFDLPWNPMTIEQRVGRVHRIGQTRDVYVFNLCLTGSAEERILDVLHDKINLFELVAGEMEMILGHLDEDQDFATTVMDLWARNATPDERARAFSDLASRLSHAKRSYLQTQSIDRAIFGEDYEA